MNINRDAFTLIEIIFVIVILGILAAVAIPKLSVTRDDAVDAKDCKNIAICITDLAAEYTATTTVNKTSSLACVRAEGSNKNSIGIAVGTTSVTVTGAPQRCNYLNTTTQFGGTSISQ